MNRVSETAARIAALKAALESSQDRRERLSIIISLRSLGWDRIKEARSARKAKSEDLREGRRARKAARKAKRK